MPSAIHFPVWYIFFSDNKKHFKHEALYFKPSCVTGVPCQHMEHWSARSARKNSYIEYIFYESQRPCNKTGNGYICFMCHETRLNLHSCFGSNGIAHRTVIRQITACKSKQQCNGGNDYLRKILVNFTMYMNWIMLHFAIIFRGWKKTVDGRFHVNDKSFLVIYLWFFSLGPP